MAIRSKTRKPLELFEPFLFIHAFSAIPTDFYSLAIAFLMAPKKAVNWIPIDACNFVHSLNMFVIMCSVCTKRDKTRHNELNIPEQKKRKIRIGQKLKCLIASEKSIHTLFILFVQHFSFGWIICLVKLKRKILLDLEMNRKGKSQAQEEKF